MPKSNDPNPPSPLHGLHEPRPQADDLRDSDEDTIVVSGAISGTNRNDGSPTPFPTDMEKYEGKEEFELMEDHDIVNGGTINRTDLEIAEDVTENSPIDVVRATVKVLDNPLLPTFTFRVLLLGTIFCALGAAVSEFYYFRSNSLQYSSFFVTLVAYPLGNFMARVLPSKKWKFFRWEFTLNSGPFNIKEHCLIVIIASSGGVSAYGTDILAVQDLYYSQNLGHLGSIMLLISTQCLGYGMAGFFRKYLVYPATMVWPSSLPSVTLFNTFHEKDAYLTSEHTTLTPEQKTYATRGPSRMRFFMVAFVAIFVYELFPLFIMPVLSSLAVLCFIGGSNNWYTNNLGSAFKGSGILNFGLDWNVAGAAGPLYTPWWAQVNIYIGAVIVIWIIGPVIFFNNFWNAQRFPIMTTLLYDNTSHVYNHTRILTNGLFNASLYASYSPVIMTPYNAMMYALSFLSLSAAVTHVVLYYGRDLRREFWLWGKKTDNGATILKMDVHTKMMSVYPEVPTWWYLTVFVVTLAMSMVVCEVYPIYLPWWALLIAIVLALSLTLPIGIIQAISGTQPGLNVITEMVCGHVRVDVNQRLCFLRISKMTMPSLHIQNLGFRYMLPGRPIANVTFKCYGYMAMYQCLNLISDLKLGLYMKIPPRKMFMAQFYGTILGGIINYATLRAIIDAKRDVLEGKVPDPTGQWTGRSSSIFYASSIIWGAVGPAKLFGPDSSYSGIYWSFLIGAFLPVPFWALHKLFPKSRIPWHLINIPVIIGGAGLAPQTPTNVIITSFIVGFTFQFYIYRYHHHWWAKYNYVLSAALDSGTFICSLFLFLCVNGLNSSVHFPTYWGSPDGNIEYCGTPAQSGQ